MLTPEEKIRYERQLSISAWNDKTQLKLKEANVFVAGAGGLGSTVLMFLAAAGVGTLRICDHDSVSLSNLNRQLLHSEPDIGSKKVDSAIQTLSRLNSEVKIIPLYEKITDKNAPDLVNGSSIIVDCLDNFPARFILNRVSVDKSIPLVHGGISEFQGQLSFFHPTETPCLKCIFNRTPVQGPPPVLGATAGAIASLQAIETIKYLTDAGGTLKNMMLFFDGRDMSFEKMKLLKNPRCPVCSNL